MTTIRLILLALIILAILLIDSSIKINKQQEIEEALRQRHIFLLASGVTTEAWDFETKRLIAIEHPLCEIAREIQGGGL